MLLARADNQMSHIEKQEHMKTKDLLLQENNSFDRSIYGNSLS